MNRLGFEISVLATLPVMVAHACRTRGWLVSMTFFLMFFFVLVEKERTSSLEEHLYTVRTMRMTLDGVPVVVVVGWLFAFYVGWCLAENLVTRSSPRRAGAVFPTLSATMVVIAAIALAMEAVGTRVGWWVWNTANGPAPGLPVLTMFWWPSVGFDLLLPFFVLVVPNTWNDRWPAWARVAAFVASIPLLVVPVLVPLMAAGAVFVVPMLVLGGWFVMVPRFAGEATAEPRDRRDQGIARPPAHGTAGIVKSG